MAALLTTINPTHVSALLASLVEASVSLATATARSDLVGLSRVIRGATDSLKIISAQQMASTATGAQYASATSVIYAAVTDLTDLRMDENNYSMNLNLAANTIYTVLFAILLLAHTAIALRYAFWYFGGSFFCGCGLAFAGYLARTCSVNHEDLVNPFLVQIICLTIAPAFLMAGVYYVLGRVLIVHGTHFSMLQPRWFSYIFVSCDVLSLVIQAAGGGMAAEAVLDYQDTASGTHVMVAGIAFQVVSMTLFYGVLADFVYRIYFKAASEVKCSFHNFTALLFNTRDGRLLREQLEPHYDEAYAEARQHKLMPYMPLAFIVSVFFIYVRCVYRVVELSQGWSGYTITHEVFLMTLDALMVFFAVVCWLVFHPAFIWGGSLHLKPKPAAEEEATTYSDQTPHEKEEV